MNDAWVLSANNVKMPGIIYGTAWKKDKTAELVEQAIRQGFRGIDTACQPKHYHEAGVGEGIAACISSGIIKREKIYLQTKFTSHLKSAFLFFLLLKNHLNVVLPLPLVILLVKKMIIPIIILLWVNLKVNGS
jgi:predicted aldo/keto reductase-like oxidoreductase